MPAKHGPPVIDEKKRKLKDIKNTTYRDACADGYKAVGRFQHAHHVIPCCSMASSIASYFDPQEPEYRRALYYFTEWDINAAPNLIGLPTLAAYEASFRAMRKRNINVGRPHWYVKIKQAWELLTADDAGTPKYPIHSPDSFGHPMYSVKVEQELDAIWNKLVPKIENHEPVDANSLKEEIQAVSNDFRGRLKRKAKQRIEDWDTGKLAQFRMA